MSIKHIFTSYSKIICLFLLSLIIVYYYSVHYSPGLNDSQRLNLFKNSTSCLLEYFETVNKENFLRKWLYLDTTVNKCNKDLLNVLKIEEFPNLDETKRGILPKYSNSNCTVITLGIGNDTLAEKAISKKLSQCKFLGIDPDAEFSGNLYKTDLKGIYVQGVIGAKNNTQADSKEEPSYPNFSFQKFLSTYFPHKTLDYLLMDIEEDEWDLMKDLIDNPDKYPIICQINVEYHKPDGPNAFAHLKDIKQSLLNGPYFPLKIELNHEYLFNRIFYVNNKDDYCIKKYL
uniref:Methyltransferase FkbM domain-containing protein n=1 Tax=Panagrolaimus sp. PS1159 TaxID=55785 RepID=A0AC35GEJ4_9BILA